jgi:hypothetical protein
VHFACESVYLDVQTEPEHCSVVTGVRYRN